MKKVLYFDKTVHLLFNDLYIIIDNGKIREYHGYNFVASIIFSFVHPKDFDESKLLPDVFEIESEFNLVKISKYDRKKLGIKGNYKVDCRKLNDMTVKDVYLKVNPLEKFIIDFEKRESFFHNINFKKGLVYYLIFPLLLIFIGYYINKCSKENILIQKTIPKQTPDKRK